MMYYESVITPERKAEGWRIPSIKELGSIVQERCNIGVFNVSLFPQKGMNDPYFISSSVTPYSFQDWNESPQGYVLRWDKSRVRTLINSQGYAGYL